MGIGEIVLLLYSVISIGAVYAAHYWFMREKDYEWRKYVRDSFLIIGVGVSLTMIIGLFVADHISKAVS